MKRIDHVEYKKRLDHLGGILKGIAAHADVQAATRCPYKNRFDECTAKFGCRNQRRNNRQTCSSQPLPLCACDDGLDYRSAWESDPEAYERTREAICAASHQGDVEAPTDVSTVSHDKIQRPSVRGRSIFDYADDMNVRVPTSCGRTGHCHECIVEIVRGGTALSPPTEAEGFLAGNFRLACQAVLDRTDEDVGFTIMRRTPRILRPQDHEANATDPVVKHRGDRVFYGDEAIDRYRGRMLGMCLDLGTTTMVAELVDLESGHCLATTALENPQRFGGSDVMHRISYDGGPFAGELHQAVINATNTEIRRMAATVGCTRHEIYEIVVVGNPTMRDIFFGIDVQSIGQKPYKSLTEHDMVEGTRTSTALNAPARQLGLYMNRNARLYGAPLIASHVGADVAADLVAINLENLQGTVMLVDAGTNTEVVLASGGRILAASCPAGPAFEGGVVTHGMPGCDGAIEAVTAVPDGAGGARFKCRTIGDIEPTGICGSGLIDLLAELRRHELMTPKGVFAGKRKQWEIVPERGITFSRRDASELAQAKAANYCGQMMLMRQLGLGPEEVDRLYLAGGFANYVEPSHAVAIGFLAPVPADRIVKVGNAAAQGARMLLLSASKRNNLASTLRRIEHVELETMPDFFEMFVEGCQCKPMSYHPGDRS